MDLTAPARRSSGGYEPVKGEAAERAVGEAPPSEEAVDRTGAAERANRSEPLKTEAASRPPPSTITPAAPDAAAAEARARRPRRRLGLREWVRDHDESWLFVAIYLGLAVGLSVFVSLFWLLAVAGLHLLFEVIRQAHYRDGKANVFMHALWEIKLDLGLVLLALMLVLYIEVVLGLLGVQSAARAAAVTRAGARLGSRAAAWERNIRTFLLTMDEMVRIVYAGLILRRRGDGPEEEAEAALHEHPGTDEGLEARLEAAAREVEKREKRRRRAEKAAAKRKQTEEAIRRRQEESERKAGPHADGAAAGDIAPPPSAWRRPWGWADRIGVALVVIGVLLIVAAPYLTPHGWGSATAALLGELRPFP